MHSEPYRAPAWLPGGHAQTIYPSVALSGPLPRYRRERWDTPDGDFIELDWLEGEGSHPLIVLFHGLEGSSSSHYSRAFMRELSEMGWSGVMPHFRGCSGQPNLLPRAYHSGDHAEIRWILQRVARERPNVLLFAAGVSLGGNALLKWLAQSGREAAHILKAAASVSAPLNLAAAGDGLAHGFNRLYTKMFLRSLKRKGLEKLARFPGLYSAQTLQAARTLRAFDDVVTGPLHGFKDAQDYWTQCSSLPELRRIELPTLLINARNDPFLPGRFLPAPEQLSPSVAAEFPEEGGHAGFVSGAFPGHLRWLPSRVTEFFRSVIS
ncbi:MAG: hydrolase [Betaproteobacteria bacterium]|nr:hydrolase [Betaproteobacteria bacterium]